MSALAFRRATPEDLRCVLQNWLDSYRTSHAAGLIQMDDWRTVMEPQLRKVLARPGVVVMVAHHPDEDPSSRADIYGWIAAEHAARPLVHFIYVKQAYRQQGLARRLMAAADVNPAEPFEYTCKTAVVTRLAPKIPEARWSPLTARFSARLAKREE